MLEAPGFASPGLPGPPGFGGPALGFGVPWGSGISDADEDVSSEGEPSKALAVFAPLAGARSLAGLFLGVCVLSSWKRSLLGVAGLGLESSRRLNGFWFR